jgi:hypothetical protein
MQGVMTWNVPDDDPAKPCHKPQGKSQEQWRICKQDPCQLTVVTSRIYQHADRKHKYETV